jgi:hypothetical protein
LNTGQTYAKRRELPTIAAPIPVKFCIARKIIPRKAISVVIGRTPINRIKIATDCTLKICA